MLLVAAATGLELSAALGIRVQARQGELFAASAYGRHMLALVTGVGVVNAALALGRALEQARAEGTRADGTGADGVVCLGVAGSFDLEAHPLCCARLVERETWPEYGLLFSGQCAADARALGFSLNGAKAAAPGAIFERLEWDGPGVARRMGLAPAGLFCAHSLTVSGVSADPERAKALHERFDAGLENMEGFAMAYAAERVGLPFAELRTVSNPVGARPPAGWDLPGALAALGVAAQNFLAPTAGPVQNPQQRT
ncbi:MAG TPA: futalosine hydrolase [Humidesulfovibrio sp.]|uniref:futalosine hydrolase n=1 Tax=Humidesulfovibrio sp. TaxID=2910988 RepID=UPI002BB24EB7|nr:futalosine hydrolase [Humidesulfovibrio sp.]HWR03880.1 futalosine hydrolase [Humidesulfovibrio sp.]